MTKKELISKIAKEQNISIKDVDAVINAAIEDIMATVAAGESVQFLGFGTFEAREHAERAGTNLQTGEKMIIPAGKSPVFKVSKAFKDMVK